MRTAKSNPVAVEHPALSHCVQLHQPWRDERDPNAEDDEDEPDVNADGDLDLEAGHGTFIAGVVRQICPDAHIHVDGVLSSFGDGDDLSIGRGIRRAIQRSTTNAFDIVVMSLGTYTEDDTHPPLSRWIRRYLHGAVVVAAAGNLGSPRPMWPAAQRGVIGVGALDASGRAWFSNHGGWVDACAIGVDVVSTFFFGVTDEFVYCACLPDAKGASCQCELKRELRRFDGWARWSGTSFAAPKVAGAIAQEMYTSGVAGDTARQAWARLSDWQRYRYPDLGTVFNI
jgi:subtilisin family serine protease